MEIFSESMERIESPDLARGWIEKSTRTVHHEAVAGVDEVWHYEVIREYPGGGRDVEKEIDVPGVPAQEAWDEEIEIGIYHPYTQEELDAIEAERNKPTAEDRIAALEARLDEYEAAYQEGVQSA